MTGLYRTALPAVSHVATPSGPSGLATMSGFFGADNNGTLPINVNPADVIVEQANGSHDPFNFSAAFPGFH